MLDLLTVRESAQLLKVNPITIRRSIAAGRLPAVRVGKGIRVHREAIDRLLTPVEPTTTKRALARRRGKLFTKDDTLFNIIGIAGMEGRSPDEPTDVASNKYKYLADAYTPKP